MASVSLSVHGQCIVALSSNTDFLTLEGITNQTITFSNNMVYIFISLVQNGSDNQTRYVTVVLNQKGAVSKTVNQTATDQCDNSD